jgi:hypothetical protein
MEWLKNFENERGVAYVIAIVSVFSPSVLASYWLDLPGFDARPWILTLVLAGSIGGISNGITIIGCLMEGLVESRKTKSGRIVSSAREGVMVRALAFGPPLALTTQSLALGAISRNGGTFKEFVSTAVALSTVMAVGVVATASASIFLKNRQKVAAERDK